jgi:hypothetical protein
MVLFFNSFEYFMEYFCFRLYDLLDFQQFLKVFFFLLLKAKQGKNLFDCCA